MARKFEEEELPPSNWPKGEPTFSEMFGQKQEQPTQPVQTSVSGVGEWIRESERQPEFVPAQSEYGIGSWFSDPKEQTAQQAQPQSKEQIALARQQELNTVLKGTRFGTQERNAQLAQLALKYGIAPQSLEEHGVSSGRFPSGAVDTFLAEGGPINKQLGQSIEAYRTGKRAGGEIEFAGPGSARESQSIRVNMPRSMAPGTGRMGALQRQYGEQTEAYKKMLSGQAEGYKELEAQQLGAAEKGLQAGLEQASKERTVLSERARAIEDINILNVKKEQARREQVDSSMRQLKKTMFDFQRASIDPNRLFKNADGSRDYPKTIAAALAVGLGALGASLPKRMGGTGGANQALQIIDKAIDRDIAAQRADIDKRRMGIGMQQNMLSMMRNQFSDERQAESAAKINMLQQFEMELDRVGAESKSPILRAKYDQLKADIHQKYNEIGNKFELAAQENAIKSTSEQFNMEERRIAAAQRSAQMQMAMDANRAKLMKAAQQTGTMPGTRIFDPSRPYPSKAMVKDAAKLLGDYNGLKSMLDEAMDLRSQYGTEWGWGEKKALMDSLGDQMKLVAKEIFNMGARLEPGEEKMLEGVIGGDLTSFGYVMDRLKSFDRRITDRVAGQLKPMNLALEDQPISRARKVE
jgi:hypothetical protein